MIRYIYIPLTQQKFRKETATVDPVPQDACYATAHFNWWGQAILHGWATSVPDHVPVPTTIQEQIDQLDDKWSLVLSQFPNNGSDITQAIWDGTEQTQTYGVAIMINVLSPKSKLAVQLSRHLPDLAEMINADSPHQPEAAALYVAHILIKELLYKHPFIGLHLLTLCINFCLNNKSVHTDTAWTYKNETLVFNYLKADYNIIQGIQHYQDLLPIKT